MLVLKDVHTYYGNIHALKGISLNVEKGEIVTLIGSNGAGKSTTLRTIQGINKPRSGTIILEGEELEKLPPHEIAFRGVAQSPEGRMIFPRMSALSEVLWSPKESRKPGQFSSELTAIYKRYKLWGANYSSAR